MILPTLLLALRFFYGCPRQFTSPPKNDAFAAHFSILAKFFFSIFFKQKMTKEGEDGGDAWVHPREHLAVLKDSMNKRFDSIDRRLVALKEHVTAMTEILKTIVSLLEEDATSSSPRKSPPLVSKEEHSVVTCTFALKNGKKFTVKISEEYSGDY